MVVAHSHSEYHILGAYTSCWSPLSGREAVAEEWVVQALEVGSVLAVSSPSSRAPFGWRVSSCPEGSGLDVTHGDERDHVVASPHAAVEALVAG